MLNRLISGLAVAATLLLGGCTGMPQGVAPVGGFQLERYLGTWHEIARLDHSFERGLSAITATYSPRADGGIDVLNRGWDPVKGAWREARGRAYFIGAPDTASLKVSFFGPFYGGYHVFALDPAYGWALISGPSRDYFWILARQPELSPALLADLLERARRAGFDTQALISPQPQPQPQPLKGTAMMIVTKDPITLNDVTDLANAPFLIEGQGSGQMKIYFESEANKQEYLATETHGGVNSAGLKAIFDDIADSPITGSIN